MNELQVKVQQTPGTVTWNYEDLKKAITNALEVYKTTEYDDSNIGQAKKDRAMLNNLSKSVNARKIEIKKKCLEPYELIETQAKELMAIIQEPIAVIDERLTEYETARRKKARAVILEYMQKAFEGIEQQPYVYFVHSYAGVDCDAFVSARTEYGAELTAAVERGNVYGTQFHPEKSGEVGLKILKAFCEL